MPKYALSCLGTGSGKQSFNEPHVTWSGYTCSNPSALALGSAEQLEVDQDQAVPVAQELVVLEVAVRGDRPVARGASRAGADLLDQAPHRSVQGRGGQRQLVEPNLEPRQEVLELALRSER